MRRRVVITGMGLVSPLGNEPKLFFRSLMKGHSGLRRLRTTGPRTAGVAIGGPVEVNVASQFPRPRLAMLDRFSQLALIAVRQALADSPGDPAAADRRGVYVGTAFGPVQTQEQMLRNRSDGSLGLMRYPLLKAMSGCAASQIAAEIGAHGPSLTYSSACASSAIAIGEAFRAIQHGYIDWAVAGGAESQLNIAGTRAWTSMRVLASEDPEDASRSCRPFSRDRTGLVLGDGAGMIVLESLESARQRHAPVLAELAGFGCASDAVEISKPSLAGQARAMQAALDDARVDPQDVDYINAHGTGSVVGDLVETLAIHRVFGSAARLVPVSSTKSMHGHLMGASAAVELIACVMALNEQAIPPTANLRVPDPECDLDYVPDTGRPATLRVTLSNTFAFGGTNASLMLRRTPERHP